MKESTKKMATVQYINKRKPVKSKAELELERKYLRVTNMYTGGGDDCA